MAGGTRRRWPMGLALGFIAAIVVSSVLTPAQLDAWGWRLPFLVALPLGVIGLCIRLRLTETPVFQSADMPDVGGRLATVWRAHRGAVLIGFFLVAVLSGGSTCGSSSSRRISPQAASSTYRSRWRAGLADWSPPRPWLHGPGRLSDRVGRRPMLLVGLTALCFLPLPAYALATTGSARGLLTADVLIGAALALLILPSYLAECFPADVRATGLGLTFGLATALVGGTAPLVAAVLTRLGVSIAAPAYLTVLAVIGLVGWITATLPLQWAAGVDAA